MLIRNTLLVLCGAINVFFGIQLIANWHLINGIEQYMWVPGTITLTCYAVLSIMYHIMPRKQANVMYDELVKQRFYKFGAFGYAAVGFGVFVLFSIQDWENWSFAAANTLLLNLSGLMFLTFGALLLAFFVSDMEPSDLGN
ncbi:MAG: hypothetical protein ACPGCY_02610 [Henriciella sp.]